MRIISQRKDMEATSYTRSFDYTGHEGWGFAFPCSKEGVPELANPNSKAHYEACLAGTVNGRTVIDRGIETRTHTWIERAIGACEECGSHVTLQGFTNTCECGADYNWSGSRLADRSQWGEETGECVSDILRADFDAEDVP